MTGPPRLAGRRVHRPQDARLLIAQYGRGRRSLAHVAGLPDLQTDRGEGTDG